MKAVSVQLRAESGLLRSETLDDGGSDPASPQGSPGACTEAFSPGSVNWQLKHFLEVPDLCAGWYFGYLAKCMEIGISREFASKPIPQEAFPRGMP